jgi:opacity protein-like surface antigen
MNKLLITAALCAVMPGVAQAAVTVSSVAGAATDLTNIFVGDNFDINVTAFGPVGESIIQAGGYLSIAGGYEFTGYDVGNYSDDLSTTPVVFKLHFLADSAGPASFTFNFSYFDTNVASYGALTTNTLDFAIKSPAPEPASWALMVAGFGVVGGAMRSHRKAAVTFA